MILLLVRFRWITTKIKGIAMVPGLDGAREKMANKSRAKNLRMKGAAEVLFCNGEIMSDEPCIDKSSTEDLFPADGGLLNVSFV